MFIFHTNAIFDEHGVDAFELGQWRPEQSTSSYANLVTDLTLLVATPEKEFPHSNLQSRCATSKNLSA